MQQLDYLINIFDNDPINFAVFDSTLKDCKSVDDCRCTERIIECLKYYQTLCMIQSNDQQKMVIFCQQNYPLLLDDYIHIITEHNNDLDHILEMIADKGMISCDFVNCKLGRRHFRNRKNDKFNHVSDDPQILFYRNILDAIHCYIYHLYDVGLRIQLNNIMDTSFNDNNESDEPLVNICNVLNHKKATLDEMDGLDAFKYKNNKFSITTNCSSDEMTDITFMDGLYEYMTERGILCNTLKHFIDVNQYDSDSILEDIGHYNVDNGKHSNISLFLNDNACFELMQRYIRQTKFCQYSFNIGYRFYYWAHFKYARSSEEYLYDAHNDNDHSGHLPHELYIEPKYTSIKEEILNNKTRSLHLSEFTLSIIKATKYMEADKVKQITAGHGEDIWDTLHYNIEQGTRLSVSNLLSVVFYCDWSELSSEFSKSFRKIKPFEPLDAVKQRNREYAMWSKYLRETVEYFGKLGWDYTQNKEWNNRNNRERGPFFCGMSTVMALPQFNMRLCSPTSTTKLMEVAMRFGGDYGIIIQLNNVDQINSVLLRSWDCSWLSNFNGENERLFIGGYYTIKIENIRVMETKKNYYKYLKSLYYFDCMITGHMMDPSTFNSHGISEKDHVIIDDLIQHALSMNGVGIKYPKYVYDTFEAFVNMKNQITLNLEYLDYDFKKLSDLIMHPITTFAFERRNLFKPFLVKLFKNVRNIIIYSTGWFDKGQEDYEIDLLSLLQLLDELSILVNSIKITIKAACHYRTTHINEFVDDFQYIDHSWIGKLCMSESWPFINTQYMKRNYDISLIQTQSQSRGDIFEEEWLVIEKCV